METDKKVAKRTKRVEHTPILTVEVKEVAPQQSTEPETQPQQNPQKPTFTAPDQIFRDLLLERPGVPCVTNIQEAIAFIEVYQKWNRKVQTAFK